MAKRIPLCALVLLLFLPSCSTDRDGLKTHRDVALRLRETGLKKCESYALLQELVKAAPRRLSGSPDADAAVQVTKFMMERKRFENVHVESLMVPRWVRGPVESAAILNSRGKPEVALSVCALGGSIGTPAHGVTGKVVEVHSFEELRNLNPPPVGKIVFFNRPMDPIPFNTFDAYGGAVDQRSTGALEAGKVGAVAALVRSMTLALDDAPHTGSTSYTDTVRKIPVAAISTIDATLLSERLRSGDSITVRLTLSCESYPDVPSGNVIGQITGWEKPNDIILVGGHLDCWDKGHGAHDDGSGCMRAIEVLNLLKKLEIKPRRTIRAVMFMNEENGSRGGKAYANHPRRAGERHVAAIESDRGGFAPRGFSVQASPEVMEKLARWKPLFDEIWCGLFISGGSGVDIEPLVEKGAAGFGLIVESHRYFDYHHSDNDTVEKVHPRELEMGAIAQALLCYLISEEGL